MTIPQIIALALGLGAWYWIYGLECYMNGVQASASMPFRCLAQDLSFNLPGGWDRRMKATKGDAEWAGEFPGWWHIWTMHFCLPFGLFILIRFLQN